MAKFPEETTPFPPQSSALRALLDAAAFGAERLRIQNPEISVYAALRESLTQIEDSLLVWNKGHFYTADMVEQFQAWVCEFHTETEARVYRLRDELFRLAPLQNALFLDSRAKESLSDNWNQKSREYVETCQTLEWIEESWDEIFGSESEVMTPETLLPSANAGVRWLWEMFVRLEREFQVWNQPPNLQNGAP